MRLSSFPLRTLREVPSEAEIISHQLMLRAGLIRRLTSGIYTWMPLGLRVLRRVEHIVREEMDRAGAHELLMPAVQPAELWRESGRWDKYGPLLLRIVDRHQRDFCFGPTHEEVITDLARREIRSYRQLPLNLYQIQTKFRDEIRPRFGVMRAREFIMKDAYSFHVDQACLEQGYQRMREAYTRIFTRLGLKFRAVEADSGEIGGSRSEEFHVLADSGEDAIAWCEADGYAANVETAEALAPAQPRAAPGREMHTVDTPGARTISEVARLLQVPARSCLKTLLVQGSDGGAVALVLRGDHELNALKAVRLPQVAEPLQLCDAATVLRHAGCEPGYIGPVNLSIPVIADRAAAAASDFVCGANRADAHLAGVNWGRDLPEPEIADLRNVVDGDPSPRGGGVLRIDRGIEVGHIFQLGLKYSEAMGAMVQNEAGQDVPMAMGCYGIGVSRIVAAAIEQNHDDRGILWPMPMAPFEVVLVPLNYDKSDQVRSSADTLYDSLRAHGIAVLLDDRAARPGVKFADAELVGIPQRVVIGERSLAKGCVEFQRRQDSEASSVEVDNIVEVLVASRAGAADISA